MSIYTTAELIQLIKDIDAAIASVLLGKAYELDTGQGRQKVTRQDLKQLRLQREYWIAEYEAVNSPGLLRVNNRRFK